MARALSFLFAAIAILAASGAQASNAWPRGKNKVFASVTWSTWGDIIGYTTAIQEPWVEPPILEQTEEIGMYAEYGLTDRFTLGIDHYNRPGGVAATSIFFLRGNVGSLDWANKFAIEIGAGPATDWMIDDEIAYRIGAGWGRGFETPWGGAWADIDAKYTTFSDTDTYLYKVDTTVGISPSDKSLWYLQVQSGALEDYPSYTRLVPTYVRKIGYGMSLESALLWGVKNDESQGVKFGAWFEF